MHLLYLGPEEMRGPVQEHLAGHFDVYLALDEETVDQTIADCDAILDAYMRVNFPAERLEKAAKLKLFLTATTGADHIDAALLEQRDIPLLTLKGQTEVLRNITPAAELSWLLLLSCARRLRAALQEPLAGQWDRNKFPGIMLRGKTLGIIGCGRIGQWMSRYAAAFGMHCLGYDPHLEEWPEGVEKTDLKTLLKGADFVTTHVHLSEETRHLLGADEFKVIKSGAALINTSRGDVIDETALLAALVEGRVGAAGLDVLTGEPDIATHPLVEYARSHDNLVITPHIGGFSPDALEYVLAFSCRRILEFFQIQQ